MKAQEIFPRLGVDIVLKALVHCPFSPSELVRIMLFLFCLVYLNWELAGQRLSPAVLCSKWHNEALIFVEASRHDYNTNN